MKTAAFDLQPFVDKFIKPGLHNEINEEIRQAIEQALGRAIEDIKIRLARRIPGMIARVAVDLSTMLTVESINREIRITIHAPREKEEP